LKNLLIIFFITILALILLGIKVYPNVISQLEKESNSNSLIEDNRKEKDLQKVTKADSFPFRTEEEEELASHNPNKFQIVKRMYNSLDTIHNAYGSFQYRSSEMDNMSHVKFYVDYDQKLGRESFKEMKGKVIKSEEVLIKDSILLRQKPTEKIYNRKPLENRRTSIYSTIVTNSEWYILIYNNYQDWEFKEGEKFGLPVYLIEGNIREATSEELAGPFTMVVSKETGALLDLKCYQKGDKSTLTVTVEEIKINEGVSEEVFYLDINSDRELPNLEYNISDLNNYQKK
jgi:outer membrane lipoprotein-sorting protein